MILLGTAYGGVLRYVIQSPGLSQGAADRSGFLGRVRREKYCWDKSLISDTCCGILASQPAESRAE